MGEPADAAGIRRELVRALAADLVGPFDAATGAEELRLPPSRWYLTGYLAPRTGREQDEDPTDDEELAAGDEEDEPEVGQREPEPKRRSPLPASVGVSVLVPPAARTVSATVSYADYERVEPEPAEAGGAQVATAPRPKPRWVRRARQPATLTVPLDAAKLQAGLEVPASGGVSVMGQLEDAAAPGLPAGTRALALFVVNRREPGRPGRFDEAFIFQVRLEVRCAEGLVPRPNRRGESSDERDERIADLQFRDRMEYAVGHGVSVETIAGEGGTVAGAATTFLPTAEVARVVTHEEPGVVTSMDALAKLADGAAARQALSRIAHAYGEWIATQRELPLDTEDRRITRKALLDEAELVRARIAAGVELLAEAPLVLDAFRLANRAMALAARQRSPERYADGKVPEWRLFQLAFLLLNLPALARADHPDRERVELIYFPTGGGKTEAYLGLIAFLLVHRRLSRAELPDRGLGVAVLLRYTLRLLTLDQLGRAATLMCALEIIRRGDPRLGPVRFSIGLWVGKSATANTLQEVADRITEYKNSTSATAPSPFPLTSCPWCNKPLAKESLELVPNRTSPKRVLVGCADFGCEFAIGKNRDGLPVLFVDESIYHELPSFLVATVDKFAMLPWRGETGMLFGRVTAREGTRFYGPCDSEPPLSAERLPELVPPELVVQDELHLIAGPLGTMVGLFEAAVGALTSRPGPDGKRRCPKIIASTATVKRAQQQVQALFGRTNLSVFPPPAVDDGETFFAKVDHDSPGRLYVGVAAAARPIKGVLLRTYVSLLGAAQRAYREDDRSELGDAYMTLAGYFNSLRELGGMRRLVEDEVRARVSRNEERCPEGWATEHPWFANREIQLEPVELTSRESTFKIAEAKARLGKAHREPKHVDVVLASNMISVGVDIERLGLMVVAGQPKSTSEYIQATSRVGRDPRRPGLVVTAFNLNKPRDRSHYERFCAFHGCFYRFVEAGSVTPFSGPALDRGLAGVLVAMTRLGEPALSPPDGVMKLAAHRRAIAEKAVQFLARRSEAASAEPNVAKNVSARAMNLLDAWEAVMKESVEQAAARRVYSPWEGKKDKPLLFTVLDPIETLSDDERKFAAPTSMRDVEPSTHLWVERKPLGGKKVHDGD